MKSVKGDLEESRLQLRRVGPDEPAVDLMGWLLKDVSRMLESDSTLGGLRSSHYRVLRAVPRGGIRITELGARVGMTTAGSGQFVKTLVESGHLRVEVDDADRRSRVVVRTVAGDRAVVAIGRCIRRIEDGWAKRVGASRYDAFRVVLAEIADG
ncbi:MAG: MarR family transcriptional regulator [Mycobacteriales bacterium]